MVSTAASRGHDPTFTIVKITRCVKINLKILKNDNLLALINTSPRLLFTTYKTVFILFLLLVRTVVAGSCPDDPGSSHAKTKLLTTLRSGTLIIFVLTGIFFAACMTLIADTVPLCFAGFMTKGSPVPKISINDATDLFA